MRLISSRSATPGVARGGATNDRHRPEAAAHGAAPPGRPWARLLAGALLAAAGQLVWATDAATEAMQAAYEPYRAALFRTNSKSQAESERALAAARAAWKQVRERFEGKAPPPYDRDPRFAATLAAVDAAYANAQSQVGQKELARAHETLEEVRDLLGELRRRNGVVVFSDHVNAYHEQMERVLTEAPRWLAQPAGLTELAFEAGALDHLAQRLSAEAGVLRDDAAFVAALKEVQASSARLRAALRAQDAAAARQALGELKPPFSRLFLRFG
ncbi:MAG: hypothetical protein JNJ89_19410 [Rubrivivax sp.]|nr:hypothetical protein [Rubrivivax sp.]